MPRIECGRRLARGSRPSWWASTSPRRRSCRSVRRRRRLCRARDLRGAARGQSPGARAGRGRLPAPVRRQRRWPSATSTRRATRANSVRRRRAAPTSPSWRRKAAAGLDALAPQPIHHVILSAGGPVLFCRAPGWRCRRQAGAVAWNGSREAARAIKDALPFLTAAEAVTLARRRRGCRGRLDAGTGLLKRHGAP